LIVRILLNFNKKLFFHLIWCLFRSEMFAVHLVDFISILCPSLLSHEGTQDLSRAAAPVFSFRSGIPLLCLVLRFSSVPRPARADSGRSRVLELTPQSLFAACFTRRVQDPIPRSEPRRSLLPAPGALARFSSVSVRCPAHGSCLPLGRA
jgi:hypothetical protein